MSRLPAVAARAGGLPTFSLDAVMVGLERLLIGRTLDGRYTVEEMIGQGRGGLAYRARHVHTGTEVALKVLPSPRTPEARDRYRKLVAGEVRTAAQVQHPNVASVYAIGHDAELDLDFVTSELVRGQTLASVLTSRGKPPIALGLRLLADAAEGLGAGHRAGLVHRDLRPASLYLVRSEVERQVRVKVVGFGVPQIVRGESLAAAGPEVSAYASPEALATGTARLTPASDVFSLGVIGFELMAGALPFGPAARAAMAAGNAHEADPPLELAVGVPPHVMDAVLQALRVAPAERFADGGSFAEALRAAASRAQGAGAPPVAPIASAVAAPAAVKPSPARAEAELASAAAASALASAGAETAAIGESAVAPVVSSAAAVVAESAASGPSAESASNQSAAEVEPTPVESAEEARAVAEPSPIDSAVAGATGADGTALSADVDPRGSPANEPETAAASADASVEPVASVAAAPIAPTASPAPAARPRPRAPAAKKVDDLPLYYPPAAAPRTALGGEPIAAAAPDEPAPEPIIAASPLTAAASPVQTPPAPVMADRPTVIASVDAAPAAAQPESIADEPAVDVLPFIIPAAAPAPVQEAPAYPVVGASDAPADRRVVPMKPRKVKVGAGAGGFRGSAMAAGFVLGLLVLGSAAWMATRRGGKAADAPAAPLAANQLAAGSVAPNATTTPAGAQPQTAAASTPAADAPARTPLAADPAKPQTQDERKKQQQDEAARAALLLQQQQQQQQQQKLAQAQPQTPAPQPQAPAPRPQTPAPTPAPVQQVAVAPAPPPAPAPAAAHEEPASNTVYEQDGVETQPKLANSVEIQRALQERYPSTLSQSRVSGSVTATFVVNQDGHVDPSSVHIVNSPNSAFNAPTANVIRRARFRPATVKGQPVRVQVTMPIQWSADQ